MAYNFNAPCFMDFTSIEEPDDSYFDCRGEVDSKNEAKEPPKMANETPRRPVKELHKSPQSSSKSKGLKGMTPTIGVRQSPRLAAIAKAMRRSNAARPGSLPSGSSSGSSTTQLNKVQKQKPPPRSSLPKVPGARGLSASDHEELAVICSIKNKPSKKGPPMPTRPQEFHFATDARVKSHDQAAEADPVDFTKMLRSNAATATKDRPRGPTKPQPFNLTEAKKGKTEENKFVSMAELNMKYYTKTPQRFRSKRFGSADNINDVKKSKPGVTIPHTPRLSTRGRSRDVNYLTHEEREQKEFDEAQKNAFKANPINKKVFEPPENGYKVERKNPTVPQPFNITEVKKKPTNSLYEARSKFGSASSIASLPHSGIPKEHRNKNTKVEAFSFDTRDKENREKKQEMIKKVLEDEKKLAEFHAHPMPDFSGVKGLPVKKPPTPTDVRPFNLMSDVRGEQKLDEFKRKQEEQERQDNEQRVFHAQPDAVLHRKPFIPEQSKKALTEISGFSLNTEKRAKDRTDYDHYLKQKEDEINAEKREMEEKKAIAEAEEVARLRREAVHKAQPVPNYKPMVVKPSQRHATVPISPDFATNSRLRSKIRATSSLNLDSTSATYTAD